MAAPLFLMRLLHQTTTVLVDSCFPDLLFLMRLLHQTTTVGAMANPTGTLFLMRLLHQTTTELTGGIGSGGCSLCACYIKPQRTPSALSRSPCCSLCACYIKPQLFGTVMVIFGVVPYALATSNHNIWAQIRRGYSLFLMRLLHQTTTNHDVGILLDALFLMRLLHQTTTVLLQSLPQS